MKQDCNHDIVIKYGVAECQNCGIEESKILNQNKMEQTAVEYVIQNVIKKHFGGGWLIDETIKKEIEQANEMFEQQIEYAYRNGRQDWGRNISAEQYYNETFNK